MEHPIHLDQVLCCNSSSLFRLQRPIDDDGTRVHTPTSSYILRVYALFCVRQRRAGHWSCFIFFLRRRYPRYKSLVLVSDFRVQAAVASYEQAHCSDGFELGS